MCHQGRTSKTTLFQSYTWLIECRFKPKRDLFASHFFKIDRSLKLIGQECIDPFAKLNQLIS